MLLELVFGLQCGGSGYQTHAKFTPGVMQFYPHGIAVITGRRLQGKSWFRVITGRKQVQSQVTTIPDF